MRKLDYTELRQFCDPNQFGFNTTKDLAPHDDMIGQDYAARALEFGLAIKKKGYNIYISGASGTGRTTFAKAYAEKRAANESVACDLCYVYNFENPKSPLLIKFPAGVGKKFRDDMLELINRLSTELPRVFAEKDFEDKRSEVMRDLTGKRDIIIRAMTEDAKEQNFGVKSTGTGIYFMPIIDGEMITEDQFDSLTQEQKDDIAIHSDQVQRRAAESLRIIRNYEREARTRADELEYSTALFAVGYHIAPLIERYSGDEKTFKYLLAVKEDILDNIEDFLTPEEDENEQLAQMMPWYNKHGSEEALAKYKVNLLVDNAHLTSAPVVVDFHPTYPNLVGEIEYDNEFGNLTTDFMKIKPGLLHKANGGYLILQTHDVLSNPLVWEALRQALLTGEIVTEPSREYMTGVTMACIRPEALALDIKIIMVGDEYFYDILREFDDAFLKTFRYKVEFDYEMNLNRENALQLARFIKRYAEQNDLLEFNRAAIAKLVEYSARLAESQKKLSVQFGKMSELMTEADSWARIADIDTITAEHIERAIFERDKRLRMYEAKLSEMIDDDIIMLDATGEKIGQINGLAVMDTGDYVFAKPSRITATTYVGKAGIVNIEKEARMSGNIHEKGIQVLTGYLGQTYAQDFPLSLSCRVCFEQNYSGIDGDSASSTELYAVLSSLAELPINQEIAVTGSINQRGEIQAIGGVTYKIEGFLELCKKRGFTGNQGVIIPKQNVNDLALNDETVTAVKEGKFHIYAIGHIDEGIEILTGVKAGEKNSRGRYPSNTVHGMVFKKLKEFYKKSSADEG